MGGKDGRHVALLFCPGFAGWPVSCMERMMQMQPYFSVATNQPSRVVSELFPQCSCRAESDGQGCMKRFVFREEYIVVPRLLETTGE